jgi:hypothetical protein
MSTTIKTTTIALIVATLSIFLSSCGSDRQASLKEAVTVSEEVCTTGILTKVSPSGTATVKMAYPYGALQNKSYLWEEYRLMKDGDWQSYGRSVNIKLRGEAKMGDTVRVVREVATYKLKTGEVFQECLRAFAEISPVETVGK